jgi:hypothetical protein
MLADRQMAERTQSFHLGGVGGDDPPVRRGGFLPSGCLAAFEPSEQRRDGRVDLACEVGQPPLARAGRPGSMLVAGGGSEPQAVPVQELEDLAVVEAFLLADVVGGESVGDGTGGQSLSGQLSEPLY